jgi:hypothetical protein
MVDHAPSPIPDTQDWNGALWKRAYFGGPGLKSGAALDGFVPANGEIKFTNAEGTAINKVFYDETGLECFLRAFHPYEGASMVTTAEGGTVRFPINGSQDIMYSNIGHGNMNPGNTAITKLTFEHLLTKLNIYLYAEAGAVSPNALYGDIEGVGILFQPDWATLNIFEVETQGLHPVPPMSTRHSVVDLPPNQMLTTTPLCFGYVMVIPDVTYTIRVQTQYRLSFYTEITLPGAGLFQPGTAYDVTLRFLASDELILYAAHPTEWWMDHTFD